VHLCQRDGTLQIHVSPSLSFLSRTRILSGDACTSVFTVTALSGDFVDRPAWNSTWCTDTLLWTMHSPIFALPHPSQYLLFLWKYFIASPPLKNCLSSLSTTASHWLDSIYFSVRLLFYPENGDSTLLRNIDTYLTRRRRIKNTAIFILIYVGIWNLTMGMSMLRQAPLPERYE
jgi:hypothetical protein